jgi:hypothetical protein
MNPDSNTIAGTTVIEAKAAQSLRSLNLDFQGLIVDSPLGVGLPWHRPPGQVCEAPRRDMTEGFPNLDHG